MSRRTIKSRTPLEADYGISKVQNLEADWSEFRGGLNLEANWYFEGLKFRGGLVQNSSSKQATVFRSPELEADQRWTPPHGRPDLHLSGGLLAEFEAIGFPDTYQTNFKD
ncbi:hypothetical protein RclHR1_32700002 [Rhizophagus clarus]|uniref:Uncharacterized protein n=1 Tax=Rhizophagus clarus TaxID=94130 RepID=A0A2Z6R8N6_9GLOM|nr:hypothetical protein RclHR1_32700002 [Rhizophagus clarus]